MAKALYRQYRPKTFDQVLGQDRVVNVLKNQVKTGKISHAYLFSGERGTGKTTCAKIFAKAVNCLNPKDGSPCLECENCQMIEDEATIDVVEMDAASNRRIDDIRNLKDNVIYPPNKLAYKVYIIDEAHMITREAFNALLKIMEEPPSHLIFILATTEIEKVPNTILSRVQKFEFSKIDENKIKVQINKILADTKVSMENEAIDLVIKKANGAMRDALSILDQILSLEKDSYSLSDVENLLGVVDFYEVDRLTSAIIGKNPKAAISQLYKLREANKSNKDILDSLIFYLNDIMIYQITENEAFFENQERLSFIKKRSAEITDLEASDYVDVLIDYLNKLKLTENTDALTEVAILRLVNLKSMANLESRIRYLEARSGENVIDLVDRILDDRLRNLDLSKVSPKRDLEKPEVSKAEEVNHPVTSPQPAFLAEAKSEVNDSKQGASSAESLAEKKHAKSLSNTDESLIMTMITRTCGGILNALFSNEGLNYEIRDNHFVILIREEYYRAWLETKKADVEAGLLEILGKNYEFLVETFEKKDNNKISESNKPQTDSLTKLREVFGEELIIE